MTIEQQKQHEAETQLQRMCDISSDAIIALDQERRIVLFNQGASTSSATALKRCWARASTSCYRHVSQLPITNTFAASRLRPKPPGA